MSNALLDSIVREIRGQMPRITSGADAGLERGIARAREWAEQHGGSESMRDALILALDRVDEARPHMAHLAGHNLVAVLERAFAGEADSEDTRLAYFRTAAGYEERRQAMQAGTEQLLLARLANEEAWDGFRNMLQDVGELALKFVVPLLLAAI